VKEYYTVTITFDSKTRFIHVRNVEMYKQIGEQLNEFVRVMNKLHLCHNVNSGGNESNFLVYENRLS
jgi:hypothetical protein